MTFTNVNEHQRSFNYLLTGHLCVCDTMLYTHYKPYIIQNEIFQAVSGLFKRMNLISSSATCLDFQPRSLLLHQCHSQYFPSDFMESLRVGLGLGVRIGLGLHFWTYMLFPGKDSHLPVELCDLIIHFKPCVQTSSRSWKYNN